jgi:hypothetical protein
MPLIFFRKSLLLLKPPHPAPLSAQPRPTPPPSARGRRQAGHLVITHLSLCPSWTRESRLAPLGLCLGMHTTAKPHPYPYKMRRLSPRALPLPALCPSIEPPHEHQSTAGRRTILSSPMHVGWSRLRREHHRNELHTLHLSLEPRHDWTSPSMANLSRPTSARRWFPSTSRRLHNQWATPWGRLSLLYPVRCSSEPFDAQVVDNLAARSLTAVVNFFDSGRLRTSPPPVSTPSWSPWPPLCPTQSTRAPRSLGCWRLNHLGPPLAPRYEEEEGPIF